MRGNASYSYQSWVIYNAASACFALSPTSDEGDEGCLQVRRGWVAGLGGWAGHARAGEAARLAAEGNCWAAGGHASWGPPAATAATAQPCTRHAPAHTPTSGRTAPRRRRSLSPAPH